MSTMSTRDLGAEAGSGPNADGSGIELEQLQARLPEGTQVRMGDMADLERTVAFRNRYARPAQHQSVEQARRFEATNPQPKQLVLIVEDRSGDTVALGQTTDGGVFARGDGVFRMGLRVAPEWRRQGIGGALLTALEAHSRAQGATRVTITVRGHEPEGMAFASRHGYQEYHRRVDSYVQLDRFDASRFDDPDEMATKAGVRLATYAELASEHGGTTSDLEAFQRHLYDVVGQVSLDIPSAEPAPHPPFEAIRDMYFGEKGFDHPTSVIAVRDGRVVGSTITTVNDVGVAYTVHTGVLRTERGKGIATALKLRAIRALRERGDVRLYGTTNDEANAAMRGINARLGYEPDPPAVQVRKELT